MAASNGSESGGELVARLLSEDTADEADEVNPRAWLGDCDVFCLRLEDVKKWERTRRRPQVVRIRRWHGSESSTIPGEFPIETVTTAWAFAQWGPGTYEFTAFDSDGNYMKRAKHSLSAGAAAAPLPGLPGVSGPSAPAPGSMLGQLGDFLQLLTALKAAGLVGGEPKQDPMREVVASIVALTQAQSAMLAQSVAAGRPEKSDMNVELLRALIDQRAPAQSPHEALREAIALSKAFAAAAPNGAPPSKSDLETFAEVAKPALPGILAMLSHLMPPDARGEYLKLLQMGVASESDASE